MSGKYLERPEEEGYMSRTPSPERPSWVESDHQESMVSSEDVLFGVASVLEHFISRSEKAGRIQPTAFDGPLATPGQGVLAFLEHIMNCGLCSKECFIMSLVYGERILQKHKDFTISQSNVHRFVLTSVLVGSKILDDFYCRNMYYAMAGGLSKADLNGLELKLCDLLDFELNVQPEEFALYRDSLIRRSDCVQHQQQQLVGGEVTLQPQQEAPQLHQQQTADVMHLGSFGNAQQQYSDGLALQHQQHFVQPITQHPAQWPAAAVPVAHGASMNGHLQSMQTMNHAAGVSMHQLPFAGPVLAVPVASMPHTQVVHGAMVPLIDPWGDAAPANRAFSAPDAMPHPGLTCGYDPLGAWGAWSTTSGMQQTVLAGMMTMPHNPVAPPPMWALQPV